MSLGGAGVGGEIGRGKPRRAKTWNLGAGAEGFYHI